MSLNWKELAHQLAEIREYLVGSVVQKIAQTGSLAGGEAFWLQGFGHKHGDWKLLIVLKSQVSFLALCPEDFAKDSAPKASTFVMVLRKHLLGVKIVAVRQNEGDRVVNLEFENGKYLCIELIPRWNNLLLLEEWNDEDRSGKCLASFRQVSLELGGRYILRESKGFEVKAVRDFSDSPGKTYNDRIFQHFFSELNADSLAQVRQSLSQKVKAARKKIETAWKNADDDAKKTQNSESLKEQALVLSENLYQLGPKNYPKTKELTLVRLADEKSIKVSLDPRISFADNSEKLFKQVKKFTRAKEELGLRLEQLEKKLKKFTQILEAIEQAGSEADFMSLLPPLEKLGISVHLDQIKSKPIKKEKQPEAKPYLELTSSDGFTILCGRNQAENRAVSFQEANGSDTWMHLKGVPGAHVVIKAQKNKTIPLSTLLEAAQVTLFYSKVRNGKKADIDYTLKKNVRSIKGTLSEVTYTDNKTIYVEADATVIHKLLREV